MSRRRTTRTIRFVGGGPRDGQLDQAPPGTSGFNMPADKPDQFHRYVGEPSNGAAPFLYVGIVDQTGKVIVPAMLLGGDQ